MRRMSAKRATSSALGKSSSSSAGPSYSCTDSAFEPRDAGVSGTAEAVEPPPYKGETFDSCESGCESRLSGPGLARGVFRWDPLSTCVFECLGVPSSFSDTRLFPAWVNKETILFGVELSPLGKLLLWDAPAALVARLAAKAARTAANKPRRGFFFLMPVV